MGAQIEARFLGSENAKQDSFQEDVFDDLAKTA